MASAATAVVRCTRGKMRMMASLSSPSHQSSVLAIASSAPWVAPSSSPPPSSSSSSLSRRFQTLSSVTRRHRLLSRRPEPYLPSSFSLDLPSFGTRVFFSTYPPHEVVGLPSLSPTMETGSIASWNVSAGDPFSAGDIFCSVETDKATVDFEAQDDGVVAKILAEAGPAELKVGDPIMITVEDGDDASAFAEYRLDTGSAFLAAAAEEVSQESSLSPTPAAAEPPTPAPPAAAAAAAATGNAGRVFASPLARMLAKEMGYNLSGIPGTGPDGRIVAADVREFVPAEPSLAAAEAAPHQAADANVVGDAAAAAAATAGAAVDPSAAAAAARAPMSTVSGAGYTDYPLSESARDAAARLVQSKRNVPHYYLTVDVNMDAVLEMRSNLNEKSGGFAAAAAAAASNDSDSTVTELGVYEFLIKAAAVSMKAVPAANASWMETIVRVYDPVNVNVSVGSGDTLASPVIADCAGKGLRAISRELHAAVAALEHAGEEGAHSTPVPAAAGTFTILNLGMYGVRSCAPIIREPQACALAAGALERRIVPNDDDDNDNGNIYKESVMMTATLSCDHRVVDGAVGAQWLAAFRQHLEDPSTLLL